MQDFKRHVLPNGLRVIMVPQPASLSTTFLVYVEAGSKYETKKNNGVSHFLEHLCFKGTKKRPTALAITSELESVGAMYNAFTGHEATWYFVKVRKEKLDIAMDVVADIYVNPVFDAKEIEKEKGVVIEELNMYEDMPMRKTGDLFTELLYGDQPAGWDVGGTKEVIKSMTREDIVKYRSEHYVAKATTVVIAGAFNEKKILADIKKSFGTTLTSKKFPKVKTDDAQKAPKALLHHKASDQTHIMMGFRAFDMFDERRYALEVLGDILGGGMGSRLFQKVREELGAAYYVRAGADFFTDHGFFAVAAGLANDKAKLVITAILGELKNIATTKVNAEELQRAKNHLTGTMMIGLEASDELAGFYGNQELFHKKLMTPKEMAKKIEAVTAEDILKMAKDIMVRAHLNLVMIGPAKDKKDFENLLKKY